MALKCNLFHCSCGHGAVEDDGSELLVAAAPELLRELLVRIEVSESRWPARKDLVSCAGVCQTCKGIMKEVVRVPEVSGKLMFPILLKTGCSASGKLLLPDADSGTATAALSSIRALSKRCPLFLAEQTTTVAYRQRVEREKREEKIEYDM
jgi:hypothetical protein